MCQIVFDKSSFHKDKERGGDSYGTPCICSQRYIKPLFQWVYTSIPNKRSLVRFQTMSGTQVLILCSSDLEVNSKTMRRRETESRSIYKAKSWSKLAWTTLEHLIKFELHIWAEQCHEATTTITSLILLSVSASQGLQPTPPSV